MDDRDVYFTINLKGGELDRYLDLKKFRDECDDPYFTVLPDNHPLKRAGASVIARSKDSRFYRRPEDDKSGVDAQ